MIFTWHIVHKNSTGSTSSNVTYHISLTSSNISGVFYWLLLKGSWGTAGMSFVFFLFFSGKLWVAMPEYNTSQTHKCAYESMGYSDLFHVTRLLQAQIYLWKEAFIKWSFCKVIQSKLKAFQTYKILLEAFQTDKILLEVFQTDSVNIYCHAFAACSCIW